MAANPDKLDVLIAGWRAALPDLDPSALELVGRVIVLAEHLQRTATSALTEHGLTLGEFDILGTLRRRGEGGMTPTQILRWVVLSSGGMTARLDKLEGAGLISRRDDPGDRRMVMIELTPKGKRVIDAATATRFAEAKASLPPLSAGEMQTLAGLLRRWLAGVSERDM
jgi:DNA-binding MarR family transcriptional regulator